MSSVLRELRRTRRARRLGELEWFDVAYRVYLAALIGGGLILWLSDLVTDEPVTPAELVDVTRHGPAVVGLALAMAIALGARSGSDGGPVALEAADVRHVLLAPVARQDVLRQPVLQRLRTVTLGGALVGAIAGQLAAPRLPGSGPAWAASAAAAGALVGTAFVAVAMIVHVSRLPRWSATAIGAAVLGLQAGAVAGWWPGLGDGVGSLAMWGLRQRPADLVSVAVIGLLAAAAVAMAGRLRPDPLVRRADLVAQLRFAVTMQDLRTVMLLRRQLRGEHPRQRPWIAPHSTDRRRGLTWAVWRRGWRGLARSPLARLTRMAGLAAAAGAAAVAAFRGTTPALVAMAVALYLLGLDALEPLSQEIDHPNQVDGMPLERGWLLMRHCAVPGLALVPFALIGAGVVAAFRPSAWAGALALAVPVVWLGAGGSAVSIVRDAPDPLLPQGTSAAVMPPEVAGFASTARLVWPVVVSALATVPVLAIRDSPEPGTVVRSIGGLILVLVALLWWVRRRDEWRRRWRRFIQGSRQRAAS